MSTEAESKFRSLERDYERAAEDAGFSRITSRIENITEGIRALPARIQAIRDRGYAYRAFLENQADVMMKNWAGLHPQVIAAIQQETANLASAVAKPKPLLTNAERQTDNENLFEKLAEQAESAIEDLEKATREAASRVETLFETLERDLSSTERLLNQIEWILDQKEEATFDFHAGEEVFLAAEAELVLTGKGGKDPDGILFLTNQRLVFEQKEKTGKRLGMFGGKMEQEVEWEAPLNTLDSVDIENKGMFKGKDMINFTLNAGDMRNVTVEVKGHADNKFWQKQIDRMIKGDTEDERAIQPDPEMVEALKNAPTACHVCGGTLPQIVAGQNEITCGYCGAKVRIG